MVLALLLVVTFFFCLHLKKRDSFPVVVCFEYRVSFLPEYTALELMIAD